MGPRQPRLIARERRSRGAGLARDGRITRMSDAASDLISIDAQVLGGVPVFRGTRVPVRSLFDYLEADYTLEEFLECFPSVSRELARRVLETSRAALLSVPPA